MGIHAFKRRFHRRRVIGYEAVGIVIRYRDINYVNCGGRMWSKLIGQRDRHLKPLFSHLSHSPLTPNTTAFPSSFPSLPSGFPNMSAVAQNPAATHAVMAMPAA